MWDENRPIFTFKTHAVEDDNVFLPKNVEEMKFQELCALHYALKMLREKYKIPTPEGIDRVQALAKVAFLIRHRLREILPELGEV